MALKLSLYSKISVKGILMQLTIHSGILYGITSSKLIRLETINYTSVATLLVTSGYRTVTANAIAYGILADREKTIALGKLVKLLQDR